MQFHPLAYIVKLKIEMSMADLITSVARARDKIDNVFVSDSQQRAERRGEFEVFKDRKAGATAVIEAFYSDMGSSGDRSGNHDRKIRGPDGDHESRDIELQRIPESDQSGDGQQGGFVVHRRDEVRMEVESLPSIDDQVEKGPRRESDERPFCDPRIPEASYTRVWGTR